VSGQTDKRTDKQTYSSEYCDPSWGEVMTVITMDLNRNVTENLIAMETVKTNL